VEGDDLGEAADGTTKLWLLKKRVVKRRDGVGRGRFLRTWDLRELGIDDDGDDGVILLDMVFLYIILLESFRLFDSNGY
jgi:hypothetical protein